MKKIFLLAVVALCATASMAEPVPYDKGSNAGRPFHFSNIGTWFSVEADYKGHLKVEGDQIFIDVNSALVSKDLKPQAYSEQLVITGLRFQLARPVNEHQGVTESSSTIIPLNIKLPLGGEQNLPPFQAVIAIPPNTDLRDRYLRAELILSRTTDEKVKTSFSYAVGPRDIFHD
jgi:hypothetical protein